MRRFFVFAPIVWIAAFALPAAIYAQGAPPQETAPGFGHGFLIDMHVAAGLTCSSCHTKDPPTKAADDMTCVNCHGDSDTVAALTVTDDPNPHMSHLGDVGCTNCHHVHMASELICSSCHTEFDFKVP